MKPADTCISVRGIHTAFCAKRASNFSFPGESHGFWELVYVIDGTVGITAGSKIYELKSGELILHKPFEFHRIWSAADSCPAYMVISFELSGQCEKMLEDMTFKASEIETPLLLSLIRQIAANEPDETSNLLFCGNSEPEFSIFIHTLNLLLVNCINHALPDSAVKNDSVLLFERVVKYMETNLEKNLSNTDFAEYANTSVSTLKRIFVRYSSLGIHSYFLRLKMIKAESILKQGGSVIYASECLGFTNQNNFSTAYKRLNGISPSYVKHR